MVATFLKAALAGDAVEETALLALADWLDEHGDPRGTRLRGRLKLYQKWDVQRAWLRENPLGYPNLRQRAYRTRYKLRKAEERLRAWLAAQFPATADEAPKCPPCRVCKKADVVIGYPNDHAQTVCPECCDTAEHANGEKGHEWVYDGWERGRVCVHCGIQRRDTRYGYEDYGP